jgi:threonine synthase
LNVSLKEAVFCGGSSTNEYFMPERLPKIPRAFFNNFGDMSFKDIAYVLANQMLGEELDSAVIKDIVNKAINFDAPIVRVDENIYALELFHGPTMAFKDFGARFMARLFENSGWLSPSRKTSILLATTGNTGAAVANAFAGVPNVKVYILFPKGRSTRQLEAQFVTLGGNIIPIEVMGSIDQCRQLVAQAFDDKALNREVPMTSANSANIARLLPQTFYYFYGLSRLSKLIGNDAKVTLAVPCGNLGNLVGAAMSKKMGLPVERILACENANSQFYQFMTTGYISSEQSIPTLAYAADKGMPSNMQRLLSLYDNSRDNMARDITAMSFDDAAIISTINNTFAETGYMCDPHTALAYAGLKRMLPKGQTGLFVATAHPAKSVATMNAITGRAVDLPLQMNAFMTGFDHRIKMMPNYESLKRIILENS